MTRAFVPGAGVHRCLQAAIMSRFHISQFFSPLLSHTPFRSEREAAAAKSPRDGRGGVVAGAGARAAETSQATTAIRARENLRKRDRFMHFLGMKRPRTEPGPVPSMPRLPLGEELATAFANLDLVLNAAWKPLEEKMSEAIEADDMDELRDVLFAGSPLRSLPLCASQIVRIAEHYPEELDVPEFRYAYDIATGHGLYRKDDGRVTADPTFNPAATLHQYYRNRVAVREAAQGGQANEPTRTGEGDAATQAPETLTPDACKYRMLIEIDFALERARALKVALEAYRVRRTAGEQS